MSVSNWTGVEGNLQVTMVAGGAPNLPAEMVGEVLCRAIEPDEPYNVDEIIRKRGKFRLIHSSIKAFIDATPYFWAHLLVTPRISSQTIERSLLRTQGQCFCVTIRLDDLSVFGSAAAYPNARQFVRSAVTCLAPFMPKCDAIDARVADPVIANTLLRDARALKAQGLRSLLFSFTIYAYNDFTLAEMAHYRFAEPPLFGEPFAAYTTLTAFTLDVDYPSAAYHAPESALQITQTRSYALNWPNFMRMLTSSPALTKLVLIGATFERFTGFLVSPPLYQLKILFLAFEGSMSMACTVSRLVFPGLETLKLTLSGRDDLDCISMCPHVLAEVPHVILVGSCSEDDNMDSLFRLMRRVERLDLGYAGDNFFVALGIASMVLRPPASEVNWNACPALRHLVLSGVTVDEVRTLVVDRERAGYKQLGTVMMRGIGHPLLGPMARWFEARSVAVTST
ncbi:hypothetical protein B0H19DRAFT_1061275 [Mycena capillaripes]|nr:hypothetical protein B0H19DRAFT_1061275 [Mycena capillaripes]